MKKKTALKVMTTAALVASLAVPFSASAAVTTSTISVKSVVADGSINQDLGSLKLSIPVQELKTGDFTYLRLPSDFKWNLAAGGTTLSFPNVINEPLDGTQFVLSAGSSANEIKLTYTGVDGGGLSTATAALQGLLATAQTDVNTAQAALVAAVTQAQLDTADASVALVIAHADFASASADVKTAVNNLKTATAAAKAAKTAGTLTQAQLDSAKSLATIAKTYVDHAVASTVTGGDKTGTSETVQVNLKAVTVASGTSGPVNVVLDGKQGSTFGSGSTTVANVGTGTVSLSIDSLKTIKSGATNAPIDVIRIKEDRPGALKSGANSLKLKLPAGFEWSTATVALVDGATTTPASALVNTSDRRELLIDGGTGTTTTGYYQITGATVNVKDDTIAKFGDVTVTINGQSSSATSTLVVATYADYGVTVSASNPKEVFAGRAGGKNSDHTEAGNIIIQENAPGTLVKTRTVTLTLNGGAKWATKADGTTLVQEPILDSSLSDQQGLRLGAWTLDGTDGKTIKATVDDDSSTATKGGKLVFNKALLDIDAGAAGQDVTVTVGGSAGATGTTTAFAKVISPATISVDGALPNVQIGQQSQGIGDLIIKENAAEAIDNQTLELRFFQNIVPTLPTKIEVTDGDIILDTSSASTDVTSDGRWRILIPVKSTSTKPSTIKVSGIKVTTDRTTPEGPMKVQLRGSALVQTAATITGGTASGGYNASFPGNGSIASAAAATLVTPSDKSVQNSAKFVIGQSDYTVNGEKKSFDSAPFVDGNGRTLLSVRALSESLGATVGWDQDTQTVSVLQNGKAISVTVGSNKLNVGGVIVALDTQAVNKDGRVFVPFRAIAEALGAKVAYDATTQTVSLN